MTTSRSKREAEYRPSPDSPDNDWMTKAACLDEDPDLFFPVGTTGISLAQVAEAKAVCAWCPVRGRCLDYALSIPSAAGIWGGLDEDERRVLLRRRGRRQSSRIASAAAPVSVPLDTAIR